MVLLGRSALRVSLRVCIQVSPHHHNARVGLQVHVRAALSHVRVGHYQAVLERRQASPVYQVALAAATNPALLPPGLL